MVTNKGFKYRLKPNKEQEEKFRQLVGNARFLWNKALAELLERLKKKEKGKFVGGKYGDYQIIPTLRKEFSFLNESYAQSLGEDLKALSQAFDDFFKRKKRMPRFRSKGERESFSYRQGVQIERDKNLIKLPKVGWVRFIQHRALEGQYLRCTISESGGKWYVSIITEIETAEPVHPSTERVGVDVGIAKMCSLSNGQTFPKLMSHPKYKSSLDKLLKRKVRLERSLARKEKGSNNRLAAKRALGKVQSKVARIRADYLHNTSAELSSKYAVIVLEDLKVSNMTASAKGTLEKPGKNVRQKAGLNREFLNHAPYEFKRQLKYKSEWKGGHVEEVAPQYTSQECPECGHTTPENRKAEKFKCVICGHHDDADINAAKNILERYREAQVS